MSGVPDATKAYHLIAIAIHAACQPSHPAIQQFSFCNPATLRHAPYNPATSLQLDHVQLSILHLSSSRLSPCFSTTLSLQPCNFSSQLGTQSATPQFPQHSHPAPISVPSSLLLSLCHPPADVLKTNDCYSVTQPLRGTSYNCHSATIHRFSSRPATHVP